MPLIKRILKIFIVLLSFTLLSCNNTSSKKAVVVREEIKDMFPVEAPVPDEKVALTFINNYVKFCNDSLETSLVEWVQLQSNVTENFKSEVKKIIDEADPEFGLGFDPIFDGQDYPDNGFELEKIEPDAAFITVKGKNDSEDFKLKIKLVQKDEKWLVDGSGVINIAGADRIKR